MRTGRPMPTLTVSSEEREALERWARRPKTAQALARRAEVVLGAAAGTSNTALAAQLRWTKQTVGRWRSRFLERRLDGLLDDLPGRATHLGPGLHRLAQNVSRRDAGHSARPRELLGLGPLAGPGGAQHHQPHDVGVGDGAHPRRPRILVFFMKPS